MSSVSLRLSADESAREDNNIALNQSMPDAYSDVKKVAMVRSSSELLPTRLEQSSWPNRLSCYRLGTTMNEVPLIGECRSCAQSYHCNCCPGCDHLVIIYAASKPRLSNITFSTVTSATGLPTIATEPSRPRSSSYWKQSDRESSKGAGGSNIGGSTIADKEKQKISNYLSSNEARKDDRNVPSNKVDTDAVACTSLEQVEGLVLSTSDGTSYNCKELNSDNVLARISEWDFPIFDFAEKHPNTTLSRITYAIFREVGLFQIFKIPPKKFFNFFHSLECGYWDIPYHNRIHAADVLHGCYYLTCHPVRALLGTSTNSADPFFPFLENSPLPISSSMSTLELMALFTAAAMHDYDHPGRTNAFLVAAEDKKAILYNDRSVLENHHAAESWRLLSKPQNCFIETLDAAETKRFRYLVLEYILATDLKLHFDIIMQFNEKSADMDLSNESNRVLVSQMLIKFADINSPSKPYPLHRQWTERICEEFYGQGDEEKLRGMAVSPYMDRENPAVAKLQDSFISHIVSPLAVALNEAGLLPVLPGLEEPEVIINLKHNHQKWLRELESQKPSTTSVDQIASTIPPLSTQASSALLDSSTDIIVEEEASSILYISITPNIYYICLFQ